LRKEQDSFTAPDPPDAVWNDYSKLFASCSGTSAPTADDIVFTDVLLAELIQDVSKIEAREGTPVVLSNVALPAPQDRPALDLTR
jgi:hypothetical protein